MSAADAAAALQQVRHANAAAVPEPAPTWSAPVCGALFAAAQVCFGLSGPSSGLRWLYIVLAVVFTAAFLVLLIRGARGGGILPKPSGDLSTRARTQLLLVAAYAIGWLVAIPYGAPGGWIGSGLTFGLAIALAPRVQPQKR